MPGYGMEGHIGIGLETVWGTAVASSDYFEALSESIVTNIDRFEFKNIINGLYEPDDAAGLHRHEGDIVLAGHPIPMGYFLRGCLGTNTASLMGSGLTRNIFSFRTSDAGANNPLTPYTLEIFRNAATATSSAFRYSGAQFRSLTLAAAPNQDLRLTVGVIAQDRSFITDTVATFPASPTYPFTFDSCSIQLAGAATALIEAFTLSLDNQLEGVAALNNSSIIARVRRTGPQMIRLSGSIEFNSHAEFNDFVNQTERQFIANFTRANSFSCLIDLPRIVYRAYPIQTPGRDRLVTAFEATARYHTGSANAGRITLTTTQSF